MKRFIFFLCLSLFLFSCTSTPSDETPLIDEQVQEPVQSAEVSPPSQESTLPQQTSPAESTTDANEDDFPIEEFLPVEEETSELEDTALVEKEEQYPPSQDYLEEIEVIDLEQAQTTESNLTEEEMEATEPEIALVVESPSDSENLQSEDEVVDTALIVEDVMTDELPPLPEQSIEDSDLIEEPNPVEEANLTDEETPVEEEIVIVETSEEASPLIVLDEIVEENLDSGEENITEELQEVEPSRSVAMNNREYLDIRYPGAGWVYLGEVTETGLSVGSPNLTYFGRRRTEEDTSFTLRSTKPGRTILHFYKQDILSATFIDDFLEVTVSDTEAATGSRVIAPDYESLVPSYQENLPNPIDFQPTDSLVDSAPLTNSEMDTMPSDETAVAQEAVAQETMELAESTMPPSDETVATQETMDLAESTMSSDETAVAQEAVEISAIPSSDETVATQETMDLTESTMPPDETAVGQEVVEMTESPMPLSDETAVAQETQAESEVITEITNENEGVDTQLQLNEQETELALNEEVVENQNFSELADALTEEKALLAQAQEYFYAEDYPASLDTLEDFFSIATRDFDAGYYLKGQILESNSSVKNVKEAQKAYKQLVDEYPQSPFWQRAKERYTYLGRFYFEIR